MSRYDPIVAAGSLETPEVVWTVCATCCVGRVGVEVEGRVRLSQVRTAQSPLRWILLHVQDHGFFFGGPT